jgi:hypothetical protein
MLSSADPHLPCNGYISKPKTKQCKKYLFIRNMYNMASASRFSVHDLDGSIEIRHGDRVCLVYNIEFNIDKYDENRIYISSITKCSDGESLTREAIKMVEDLAISNKEDGIKSIHLEDDSTINVCGVPLPLHYLKILTTGQSWYNSIGYTSPDHHAEVAHNAVIINTPMDQLVPRLLYTDGFPRLPPTLQILQSIFPCLSVKMTVKDYVTEISNQLPRSGTIQCPEEQVIQAKLLYNLIYAIRSMLRYNFSLQKNIERPVKPASSSSRSMLTKTNDSCSKYGKGGAKITIRKSRRKKRTRKYIKRKTA